MLISYSTWEVETGVWQVQGQPELYSKIQSQLLSHLCPTSYYFDLPSIVALGGMPSRLFNYVTKLSQPPGRVDGGEDVDRGQQVGGRSPYGDQSGEEVLKSSSISFLAH